MPGNIVDGLALIDSTGFAILATTFAALVAGVSANLASCRRYRSLSDDLDENGPKRRLEAPFLADIVRDAEREVAAGAKPDFQALIEDHVQSGLARVLLAERFVRAATGLVIILGLLGTFYGLTSSIGRLVHLVADPAAADVTQGVTAGLTQALSGMTVAFSNSLVGIGSAVFLTVLGVVSNPTDARVALMIKIERYLDGLFVSPSGDAMSAGADVRGLEKSLAGFDASVERLLASVVRFESALTAFAGGTRDFSEFNAHLKDNVQRMSLSFADLGDALRTEVRALKQRDTR